MEAEQTTKNEVDPRQRRKSLLLPDYLKTFDEDIIVRKPPSSVEMMSPSDQL
jgi:hypothetical protein